MAPACGSLSPRESGKASSPHPFVCSPDRSTGIKLFLRQHTRSRNPAVGSVRNVERGAQGEDSVLPIDDTLAPMRFLVDAIQGLLTLLVMPLLPEAYRRRWPWACILPSGPAHWSTSILHVVIAFLLWGLAFTAYQKDFGDRVAEAMLDPTRPSGEWSKFYGWAGIIGFFSFPFTLAGALTWTYFLDSVVRFVCMALDGEHHASIFLAAPLWAYDQGRRIHARARMNTTYGSASEPDRLFETGDRICIRSTRPHPEWHTQLTFHYRGSLFRLDSGVEVQDGPRRCFEYRFAPWPEQEIIRRVVVLGTELGTRQSGASESKP